MGYGTRALQLLLQYYSGGCTGLSGVSTDPNSDPRVDSSGTETRDSNGGHTSQGLLQEVIQPQHSLPPLLTELHERQPESLHYVGVSYGLTAPLLRYLDPVGVVYCMNMSLLWVCRFWTRNGFRAVYLRQTPVSSAGGVLAGVVLAGGVLAGVALQGSSYLFCA